MELLQYLQRMFTYNHWANRESLASLQTAGTNGSPQACQLMAHVIAAEWLWLMRLRSVQTTMAVWPNLSMQECGKEINALVAHWSDYLHSLTPRQLLQEIAYTNSKGESWHNTIQDILTHVLMHSSYHRGQLAIQLRATDQSPAYTDFIHCVRQGFIE
ncbi:MAG: DinB family protein [Acidobacteriota bacterium]